MEVHPRGIAQAALRLEEADLVRRCKAGEETAFRCILERYRSRLIRIAANLMRDRVEAEDVAQETFLKAFSELSRLRDDCAFGGFLYRICVRICIDRLRLKHADTVPFDASVEFPRGSLETRMVVRQLIERLPPELKATLVLREIDGLSYEEVAAATCVPVGTVRSRLHAAREKFRRLWVSAVGEVHK
jgi:RNA polymerase sigma-70 factor (ECF subfamily)